MARTSNLRKKALRSVKNSIKRKQSKIKKKSKKKN
jgi:hypothetical protein